MRKYREAAKEKAGYAKVLKYCEKAQQDSHRYVWIDTCCIDKRSSAELSEAINSMWSWYQKSEVCYAYFADVPSSRRSFSSLIDYGALSKSRWFTRGWTLQELIAPSNIQFLAQDWRVIGLKVPPNVLDQEPLLVRKGNQTFLSKVAEITGIEVKVLQQPAKLRTVAAAKKMFWASKRQTTREEDLAYSLMGLFGVSMPILYGEGLIKAFRRLQLEIIQKTTDQSIFVWRADREEEDSGLLADSPRDFADSNLNFFWLNPTLHPYSMTNVGLLINMPLGEGPYPAVSLGCWVGTELDLANHEMKRIELQLSRLDDAGGPMVQNLYRRNCDTFDIVDWWMNDEAERTEIYVLQDEQFEEFCMNSEVGA